MVLPKDVIIEIELFKFQQKILADVSDLLDLGDFLHGTNAGDCLNRILAQRTFGDAFPSDQQQISDLAEKILEITGE